MWRLLWFALAVFVLDQATKQFASDFLLRHGEIHVAPFLSLVLVHNSGAAFGFLSGASGWQNGLFMAVAAGACGFILWMLSRLRRQELLLAVALVLILGGAAGNLADRLIHGYVIDFIDVHYRDWHWPAFNIADSAITMGAVLLVLDMTGLLRKRNN